MAPEGMTMENWGRLESEQFRQKLLKDLIIVSAGIGNVGESADWVPARALVVMGDFLVLEGNSLSDETTGQAKHVERRAVRTIGSVGASPIPLMKNAEIKMHGAVQMVDTASRTLAFR
jgi:hypothetical protein